MQRFADKIKLIEESLAIHDSYLAKILGCTQSYVRALRLGIRKPSEKFLRRLAVFLNVPAQDLMEEYTLTIEVDRNIKVQDRLIELRKSRGLSQVQLSQLIGVPASTIASMETGKNTPSYEITKTYSQYFGLPMIELLRGE